MIKTYIRVQLGSEGESPKKVIERMRKIGAVPVVGDFDFELTIGDNERLFDRLEDVHNTLKGADVRYTITTLTEAEAKGLEGGKIVTHHADQRPAELRKVLYKAKLERWKEMGLDVSELEKLIDVDIDRFKSASKEFLRTHLDHMSIVKDRKSEDNEVDGQVLALLDESGLSLNAIISATGFTEEQVLLSLGRLIASGSATRVQQGQAELYSLVPPPAPVIRKVVAAVPAQSEDEAVKRILESIVAGGSSLKDIIRVSRLPRKQVEDGLEQLAAEGKITKAGKGKTEVFVKA